MTSIKVKQFIKAPTSEVYHYFTNSTALKDWMCDGATTEPRPGGRLFLWWHGDYFVSGEYLVAEGDKTVAFTWFGRGEPHPTKVEISLKEKDGGTRIKLIHRGLGNNKKWAKIAKVYEEEWQGSLGNLASVLEKGPDLRIINRPMLGIILTDFDAEIAKKLGVPVSKGIRLDGVTDGMGAQKAGLQRDDVITGMDGKLITDYSTLTSILSSKHAGDNIDVAYYRGPIQKTAKMTLSSRAVPLIPATPKDLSATVRAKYQQFESEMENLLKGASDLDCTIKPGPAEWSVNEVLAHLVQGERDWQNQLTEMICGIERSYDDYGGNLQAQIDATVEVFPTKLELFNQLKRHNAETVSLLAHIPAEVLEHKGRYWKLAYNAQEIQYHLQTHLDQMQAAIQSAQNRGQ